MQIATEVGLDIDVTELADECSRRDGKTESSDAIRSDADTVASGSGVAVFAVEAWVRSHPDGA